jgi:hypothetical protein
MIGAIIGRNRAKEPVSQARERRCSAHELARERRRSGRAHDRDCERNFKGWIELEERVGRG